MEATKVGIREFRADLAEYIASSTPVAVTRHGQTVGYFIPTRSDGDADLTFAGAIHMEVMFLCPCGDGRA